MPRLSKIGAAALAAFGWTSGGATSVTASYLVVAGGGGGGSLRGGGGGAGGLLTSTTVLNTTLSYTVIVGAGGPGTPASNPAGAANATSGSASSLGSVVSTVGGGGGAGGGAGLSGGSGGGGTWNGNAGGSGTAGQGYAGGAGSTAANYGSGGGGGSSAVGSVGGTSAGGNGGAGTASSISGSSVTYAGGGGGGINAGNTGGTGGSGGGTNGISGSSNASPASQNTGSGGGGAGYDGGSNSAGSGGNGGSGVVIISYAGAQQFGGGIVTSVGGNTIHTFTTSGTLSPLSSLSADYLIVGGGGGGSIGGGGAGGLLSGSALTIDTNSTYVVTVGAGGAGATTDGQGTSGTSSAFSIVSTTVIGGGGAGGYSTTASLRDGLSGGSGGGGGARSGAGSGSGGAATSGQGNAGGNGFNNGVGGSPGGGGGGAGSVGGNGANVSIAGNGGTGLASSLSGSSVTYAGGGGGAAPNTGTQGTGGSGVGGAGVSSGTPNAGAINKGGGGGGNFNTPTDAGAAGGSGIVIIRYAGSTQQMAGGTVTITGGYVIHTFTSSGYLTPLKLVNNSLRFRSSASAYLSRTPNVAGSRTTWTFSAWVKRGNLSLVTGAYGVFGCASGGAEDTLRFDSATAGNQLNFYVYTGGYVGQLNTTASYRDPAAWYHVVAVWDTTNATSTERMRLYVNGVRVTAFGTATYPSLNAVSNINSAVATQIGWYSPSGNGYYDGEMTEINFIDGQALTPNAFGTFNSYGVWQPITYGGSYGTNGFYLPFNVDKTQYSYAFNTTPSYLTSSTAGIMPLGNTTWSIECWTWCNAVPTSNVSLIANTATGGVQIFYRPAINTIEIGAYGAADVAPASVTVNNLLLNAWNHFVFTSNGTQLRIFANGILIGYTSSSYSFAASQGTVYIGTNDTTSSQTLNGFISNLRVCNGSIPTTYQTSSTTINTQVFTPPTSPLTTTSQGAANVTLLTCQSATIVDNSASPKTLAMTGTVTPSNINFNSNPFYDQGPAGNNWTPNNISLVNGSTCDSMTDVPTLTSATAANYCVLNPLDTNASPTISNGNLLLSSAGATWKTVRSTISVPVSSGKFYMELSVTANSNDCEVGFCLQSQTLAEPYTMATCVAYSFGGGSKYVNGTSSAYGASVALGDIVGIAYDTNAGTITFYKNNVSQGAITTGWTTGFYSFVYSLYGRSGGTTSGWVNFGQQPFVYTPPTGFVALNTYNM